MEDGLCVMGKNLSSSKSGDEGLCESKGLPLLPLLLPRWVKEVPGGGPSLKPGCWWLLLLL